MQYILIKISPSVTRQLKSGPVNQKLDLKMGSWLNSQYMQYSAKNSEPAAKKNRF